MRSQSFLKASVSLPLLRAMIPYRVRMAETKARESGHTFGGVCIRDPLTGEGRGERGNATPLKGIVCTPHTAQGRTQQHVN